MHSFHADACTARLWQVDARTIEKYEKEAKEKNRESWCLTTPCYHPNHFSTTLNSMLTFACRFLAFIMDTNEEERAKGKTVEANFPALTSFLVRRHPFTPARFNTGGPSPFRVTQ